MSRGYVIYGPRPYYGRVGCTYRAWTSVVFLFDTGIAKPSLSVKNRRTSRFFVCIWLLIRLEMTHFYIVHRHFVHSMNVRFLRLLPKALAFSLTERRAGEDREINGTKDRLKNVRLLRKAEFT